MVNLPFSLHRSTSCNLSLRKDRRLVFIPGMTDRLLNGKHLHSPRINTYRGLLGCFGELESKHTLYCCPSSILRPRSVMASSPPKSHNERPDNDNEDDHTATPPATSDSPPAELIEVDTDTIMEGSKEEILPKTSGK